MLWGENAQNKKEHVFSGTTLLLVSRENLVISFQTLAKDQKACEIHSS